MRNLAVTAVLSLLALGCAHGSTAAAPAAQKAPEAGEPAQRWANEVDADLKKRGVKSVAVLANGSADAAVERLRATLAQDPNLTVVPPARVAEHLKSQGKSSPVDLKDAAGMAALLLELHVDAVVAVAPSADNAQVIKASLLGAGGAQLTDYVLDPGKPADASSDPSLGEQLKESAKQGVEEEMNRTTKEESGRCCGCCLNFGCDMCFGLFKK